MPAPAIAMASSPVGAATAIAWKGISEVQALQKAATYLETHKNRHQSWRRV